MTEPKEARYYAASYVDALTTENAVLRNKLDIFAKALTERDEQIAALREKLAEREALLRECRHHIDDTYRITGNLQWERQLKDCLDKIDTLKQERRP